MSIYQEIRAPGSNKKQHMEEFYQRQEDPYGFVHEMSEYSVIFKTIKEVTNGVMPKSIDLIDYGCSEGQFFSEWIKAFPNTRSYIGVDIAPTAIQRFREKRFTDSLTMELYVGDMEEDQNIQELCSRANVVIFHESLMQATTPSKVLKEIAKYIPFGSILIISDGMKRPCIRTYYRDREPYCSMFELVGYTKTQVKDYKGCYYNRFTAAYQRNDMVHP